MFLRTISWRPAVYCPRRLYNNRPSSLTVLRRPIDNSVIDKFRAVIQYSSYLEDNVVKLGYHKNRGLQSSILASIKRQQLEANKVRDFPVALKYLSQGMDVEEELTRSAVPQMRIKDNTVALMDSQRRHEEPMAASHNWMEDYEFYDPEDGGEDKTIRYGTADPKTPPSKVPCGGCGARLHCMDESLPGYLPSQIYKGRSTAELHTLICQRCHFLKHYNTALNISVKPEEYEQFLSQIRNRPGLIILIVDLLDIPCSIWPNMLDLIGHNRPMFIVGNKVDLIPKDSRGYLDHIKAVLVHNIQSRGIPEQNIRHISLISATTGYGIEELITALHNKWSRNGDVYLCGVTNVGKSSLFNSLLRSDYCKSQASDMMQRATSSPWPGTTIKMLKFPILRISDARKYWRTMRLVSQRQQNAEETKLRRLRARDTGKIEHATLLGHIGQSFKEPAEDQANSFSMGQPQTDSLFALDESNKKMAQSKWCFDTPGVVSPDQMYSLFTIEELMLVKQKEMMRPRTFLMKPGMSLFLAGIARIDFITGAPFIRAQIYSSLELPVLICNTESAEEIYNEGLRSEMFIVPRPDEDRLKSWPKLLASDNISISSVDSTLISGDIVLSCCGWIGINLEENQTAVLKAWTPKGAGIHVRQPALLPRGMRLKGSRIRHSLAYKTGKAFVKQ